ncbi:5-oxoprolinase subunit PxpA [uncultured Winogradskyella sp.]|uniref:5-oxoprolinase subunit PxpA n=1 Tax=uncultured Winogradskyella sp. TaxID=395353 RepID=UPI0035197858
MLNKKIDINADVGEGLDNETAIMPYLSSCNISCGAHAGNEVAIAKTMALAVKNKVKIGAHPSYPDKKNFGRKPMALSHKELLDSLLRQLTFFKRLLKIHKVHLHHIKPHGALYNLAAIDRGVAQVVIELMKNQSKSVKLYVPYGSVIADLALIEGVDIVYEAFADRNYNSDLTLVPRREIKAIITDPKEVLNHCLSIFENESVKCLDGSTATIKASTFCVHGDNENVLTILKYLTTNLAKKGIEIL